MARFVTMTVLAAAALAVAGCGLGAPTGKARAEKKEEGSVIDGLDLRKLTGTVKNPPDEFSVIKKRPLQMPKNLAALPEPRPGARSTRDPDPVAEARAALLKSAGEGTQTTAAQTSVSEAALLNASGASDPNIRTALAADQTDYEAEQSQYVLDRIIPALRRLRGEDTKDLVDPQAEYQRLNTSAARPAARAARATPIAVIPSAPPTAAAPSAIAPSASDVTPAAPGTDGELIYIPE